VYETLSHRVIPFELFLKRLLWHFGLAALFIVVSLLIGMIGYRVFGPMSWLDSFLNASMLLSGMGPVAPITNDNLKLFAGIYALYAGLVPVASVGLLAMPVLHRVMHSMHTAKTK
jgi:hypothetical protein